MDDSAASRVASVVATPPTEASPSGTHPTARNTKASTSSAAAAGGKSIQPSSKTTRNKEGKRAILLAKEARLLGQSEGQEEEEEEGTLFDDHAGNGPALPRSNHPIPPPAFQPSLKDGLQETSSHHDHSIAASSSPSPTSPSLPLKKTNRPRKERRPSTHPAHAATIIPSESSPSKTTVIAAKMSWADEDVGILTSSPRPTTETSSSTIHPEASSTQHHPSTIKQGGKKQHTGKGGFARDPSSTFRSNERYWLHDDRAAPPPASFSAFSDAVASTEVSAPSYSSVNSTAVEDGNGRLFKKEVPVKGQDSMWKHDMFDALNASNPPSAHSQSRRSSSFGSFGGGKKNPPSSVKQQSHPNPRELQRGDSTPSTSSIPSEDCAKHFKVQGMDVVVIKKVAPESGEMAKKRTPSNARPDKRAAQRFQPPQKSGSPSAPANAQKTGAVSEEVQAKTLKKDSIKSGSASSLHHKEKNSYSAAQGAPTSQRPKKYSLKREEGARPERKPDFDRVPEFTPSATTPSANLPKPQLTCPSTSSFHPSAPAVAPVSIPPAPGEVEMGAQNSTTISFTVPPYVPAHETSPTAPVRPVAVSSPRKKTLKECADAAPFVPSAVVPPQLASPYIVIPNSTSYPPATLLSPGMVNGLGQSSSMVTDSGQVLMFQNGLYIPAEGYGAAQNYGGYPTNVLPSYGGYPTSMLPSPTPPTERAQNGAPFQGAVYTAPPHPVAMADRTVISPRMGMGPRNISPASIRLPFPPAITVPAPAYHHHSPATLPLTSQQHLGMTVASSTPLFYPNKSSRPPVITHPLQRGLGPSSQGYPISQPPVPSDLHAQE